MAKRPIRAHRAASRSTPRLREKDEEWLAARREPASRRGCGALLVDQMLPNMTFAVHAAILAAAARAAPDEACGLLLGTAAHIHTAFPAANVAPDPAHHFEIDPAALIAAHRAARAGGPQVVGYYHSHPNGLARPSATDAASAARDGRIWAIAAAGAITMWRDGPSGFEALSYTLGDG